MTSGQTALPPSASDAGTPGFEGLPAAGDGPSTSTLRHILALAALSAWAFHDVAVFFTSSEPGLVKELLPASVLTVTAGVLLAGLLGAREWLFATGVLVAGILAALPHLQAGGLSPDGSALANWPARLAFLVGSIVLVSSRLARRLTCEAWELSLALGCLAAGSLWAWRSRELHWISIGLFAAASLNLWIGMRARNGKSASKPRLGLLALLVLALLLTQRQATQLRRPDLARETAPSSGATGARPNLLFIVLDTVRADHLAPYGSELVTTPNLDAFVEQHATRYSEARSASSWTLPSHASLFTGLQPDEHGATRPPRVDGGPEAAGALNLQAWPARPLRSDFTTLAEILRGRGYRTGAILGNSSFLRHEFGLDQGFLHYDDRQSAWMPEYLALAHMAGGGERVGFLPYRDARRISDLALEWLATDKRDSAQEPPFFLFLNYMDAHAPYIPPLAFDGIGEERWPRDSRQPEAELHSLLYDRELAYLDRELGRVLEHLAQHGLLEDTAIVITSDHGEAFGEHGTWLHGWDLYEEVLRVPLYVKPAGSRSDRFPSPVEERPVTGMEVFSITLRALGFDALPAATPPGRTMVAQLHLTDYLLERWRARGIELPGRNQVVLLDGDRKHHLADDGRVESYDLRQDPLEQEPLELDGPVLLELRNVAAGWLQGLGKMESVVPGEMRAAPSFDEADRRRLEGLGYGGS